MPHSSPNPDQRIDAAVEALRARTSPLDPEQLVLGAHRRTDRKRGFRMKIAIASLCSTTVAVLAGIGFWPHPAMASMASMDQVLQATENKSLFKTTFTMYFHGMQGYEGVTNFTSWQLSDRIVVETKRRRLIPKIDSGKTLIQMPVDKDFTWSYPNGDTVMFEPGMPNAIRRHDRPPKFTDLPTLAQRFRNSKIVETDPAVRVHGGVYDKYVMLMHAADEPIKQTAYVDPSTHLLRFVEPARYAGKGPGPRWLLDDDTYWEFLYPDKATMEREAPAAPSEDQIVDDVDMKHQFIHDVENPAASQVVAGVKKSLCAVVIHNGGYIEIVSRGGDPRDVSDPHKIQLEGYSFADPKARATSDGNYLALVSTGKDTYWFSGFKTIAGKKYVVEGATFKLRGEQPKTVTVKVPVWKYDLRHPIKTGKDAPERVVYRSIFVGYATFTTDRIYVMPSGSEGGESLPSDYQIGNHKGKLPSPSGS